MRTLFRERGWFSGPHASPRVWEARKHDRTLERCVAVRIHHTGSEHRRSVAQRHKTPCASVRVCISGKLQPWVKYKAEKLKRTSGLRSALRWGRFGYNLLSNNDRSTFFLRILNTTARSWKPSATKSAHGACFAHFLQSQYFRPIACTTHMRYVNREVEEKKCCCEVIVIQTFMLKQN